MIGRSNRAQLVLELCIGTTVLGASICVGSGRPFTRPHFVLESCIGTTVFFANIYVGSAVEIVLT